MEVIDLDKIAPQIEREAFKRAKAPKVKKFPLMVHQTYEEPFYESEEPSNEESLSNIFEGRQNYFI